MLQNGNIISERPARWYQDGAVKELEITLARLNKAEYFGSQQKVTTYVIVAAAACT